MRNQPSSNVKRDTISVSQLNRQAKRLLEGNFPSVWVEGEISNLSRPSSGHWYFSLKDSNAQIRCAMFRSNNARLRFNVDSGQQVMARAKLSLYEARGDYQLIVEHLEPSGEGALAKAFEALKSKLHSQGLFDPERKKPLPTMVRHIAVVTSATGAAIRDILSVLNRRFPAIQITVLPTQVQGQDAAVQIAHAIDTANKLQNTHGFDVILVSRGGGSLEDLWSFNEEVVAYSISSSQLPVVSAVGHEIDFTISDFVADVRAPTPSAAAELLSPDQREWFETLAGFEQLLHRQVNQVIQERQRRLDWLHSHLKHPGSRLQEHSQRLDELELRLTRAWRHRIQIQQHKLTILHARLQQQAPIHTIEQQQLTVGNLRARLQQQIQHLLERNKAKLTLAMQLLNTVNPLTTLDRGYAIVSDESGQIVSKTSQLRIGQRIKTKLAEGEITSSIDQLSTTQP